MASEISNLEGHRLPEFGWFFGALIQISFLTSGQNTWEASEHGNLQPFEWGKRQTKKRQAESHLKQNSQTFQRFLLRLSEGQEENLFEEKGSGKSDRRIVLHNP